MYIETKAAPADMDAKWTPDQVIGREKRAEEYIRRIEHRWRQSRRRVDTGIQRLLITSSGLFLLAVGLAHIT